ncbi:MAG: cytochrome c-type biogenesis protein [Woeseiaceae bacterium]|nr:cytochrome c-type biogenesis protein [Woeseiaceae bacterium]
MKFRLSMLLACVCLVALAGGAHAIDTGVAFDDPELQARYERLTDEVRCLKCQNQTIRDSNAFLAADLRREIRRLIAEGRSDDEIKDFLVARYGEFALYRPRMSGKTLVLWIAPLVLVIVGIVVIVRVVRGRMSMPLDDDGQREGP